MSSPKREGRRRPSAASRLGPFGPLLLVVAFSLLSMRDPNPCLRVEDAAERRTHDPPSVPVERAGVRAAGRPTYDPFGGDGDGAAVRAAPFSTGDFVPNGIFHYAPPEDRDVDLGFSLPRAGGGSGASRSTTMAADREACVRAWSNVTMQTWERPGGGVIQQWPRSRFGEDVAVHARYFPDAASGPPGVFLEIGGFDGLAESNTLLFERCLGWTGVLVEANPSSYRSMIEHRPRTADLLMSPTCRGDDVPATILARGSTNAALTDDPAAEGARSVHCAPLGPALAELGVDRVDFFSLDVENRELEVLETIDFNRTKFSVVMVESKNEANPGWNSTANFRVKTLMKESGYDLHRGVVKSSMVFVRRGAFGTTVKRSGRRARQRTRRGRRERRGRSGDGTTQEIG